MKQCKRGSEWPPSGSVATTELLCEVCNSAPATVTCKADATALCTTCDTDIHTANPLASRHLRLPIHRYAVDDSTKLFGEPKLNPGRTGELMKFPLKARLMKREEDADDGVDEKEANSWLLSTPNGKSLNPDAADDGMQLGAADEDGASEVSEYLDLVHYGEAYEDNQSSPQAQSDPYIEYVQEEKEEDAEGNEISLQNWGLKTEYDYSTLLSRTVSTSSLDNGRVIDTVLPVHEGFDLRASSGSLMEVSTGFTTMQTPQCSTMDREARVLRYREKRKNRKFEKTIRYASRKAYAETRPRIKGRFAKRADMDGEVEVDTIYSSRLMVETGYGIVPTF